MFQANFVLQLHVGGFLSLFLSAYFKIFALCRAILAPILGRALQLTFTVVLLIVECRGCPGGKCTSISFKNSRPTFVATFRLQGGLNQVTGFFYYFQTCVLLLLVCIQVCMCIHAFQVQLDTFLSPLSTLLYKRYDLPLPEICFINPRADIVCPSYSFPVKFLLCIH